MREACRAKSRLISRQVCEISETASDAWSTDVLASDTSERQAERLLELDQDEVASVSSRSQGHDDSVSEPGDQTDDASQSGAHQFSQRSKM